MENSAYRKESDGLLSVVICLNLSWVPIISLCNKFLRRKGGDACLYTDRYIHLDHIVKFHVKIWSKVRFAGLSSFWPFWGWGCDGGGGDDWTQSTFSGVGEDWTPHTLSSYTVFRNWKTHVLDFLYILCLRLALLIEIESQRYFRNQYFHFKIKY